MLSRLLFLLIFGNIAEYLGNAQKLPRAKRQSLKVQINATDDTIALKFLRPSPNMQLEGFILGYGSNFFSSQYIPLPDHGKSYETEVDAEPRYLISVKPAANPKKSCSGKKNSQKPLQVVVGTLSPTSVFLSWGVLVNPQHDWAVMNNCPSDRFYTVRYREKDKTKKWLFQLCPASETVIDNLKPNTMYEFGVKDNSEEGVWNKAVNHKTSIPSKNKENGQIQNTYKIPKGLIQMAPDDMKTLIAIQVIKQVIQNATNMKHFKLKPTVGPSPPEAIPGHKKILDGIPEPTTVQVPETPRPILVVAEKAPESIKATVSTGVDLSKVAPAHSESKTKSLEPDTSTQQPASTQVPNNLQYDPSSPENSKTQEILQPESAVNVAHLPARPKTSNLPDLAETKPAVSEKQLIPSLPKASVRPEMSHTKTAISENQLIPSLPKTSVRPEMSHTKPATTSQTLPGTILAPALTSEQPVATLSNAISEKQLIPSLPKASVRPDMSHTKPAISEKQLIPSLPKASVRPEMSQTKPVTTSQTLPGTILAPSFTSEQPAVTLGNGMFSLKPALIESLVLPSQPKITSRPEIPQTKPESTSLPITKPVTDKPSDTIKQEQSTQAAYRKIGHPLTTKSPVISERQRTTMAPKTIHIAPSKPKPSSRPGAPQTKPVPNETQKPIEPEITQTSESSHTRAVPNETQPKIASSSSKPKTRQTTETPYTRVVPNVTQRTASSVPKTTMRPHSRSAPRETITEPVMSKLPVLPQRPKATLGPYRGHFRSPRPRTSARPWTRPAVNGTTQGSVRTKPSDGFNWLPDRPVSPIWLASSGESRKDGRLAGLDISKLLGVSRNTSMDPNNTRKGLVSGPSPSQRVFLSPTRHTYTRRRPYPFNNMTGRPGGPGTVMPRIMRFTAKPTQFSVARRTQMPKKQPTFPTSELEDANDTIFNPKPISELDPQGKPRFTGSHVKYIRKDDHVPCSITESIKHFPVEEASNQDITSAPQNPPSNLTIVTVEGCPSFVILDWEQPDNDTVTEYEVISKENGGPTGHDQSILTTNQTHSTVENLKPDTSYEFKVKPKNPLGEGPPSNTVAFSTESADPRVSEFISGGKDAIWTEFPFKSDGFSECKGKQYVKRTWYKKFVGIQLCNSLRYKIYLSDSLTGKFYNVGDQRGHGEDHCQFVDSFLDGRTGQHLLPDQLPTRKGYYRAFRQQPVEFGKIGRDTQINYVHWYECGTTIPGKW
uniref:Target of Nesh-SH3 isoform X45 n=1 Tax=Geotrypetes seraphini TaxID=260995 RepID=A0A6P8RDM3_GEOSA|nr:target of Nesh-SH3 isoform X45 [Geotrypetes seraphini]